MKGNFYAKRYTVGEERMNAISHGLGAVLAVVGTVSMVVVSLMQRDWYCLAGSIIYGASLMLLYLMSTLYHAISSPKVKEVLRVFDHCSIFLLIAGTYTPFTLTVLRDAGGWWVFGGIWAGAVLGVVLNIISIERFKGFSMICYLVMGWSIIFNVRALAAALQPGGLWLLVAGGLCYTVGILFYAMKKRPYAHGIWHLFVLGGSLCHFFCIFQYVLLG